MPAKKKAQKKSSADEQTKLIAMQGVLLAIIGAVVLFGILKMVQLRDTVDAAITQQMMAPTKVQVTPNPTVKVVKVTKVVKVPTIQKSPTPPKARIGR